MTKRDAQSPDRFIAEIRKSAREEFRVQLRTFKNTRSIDTRSIDLPVFASDGVDMVATANGVTIRPELIGPVHRALRDAEAAAVQEGLIPRPASIEG